MGFQAGVLTWNSNSRGQLLNRSNNGTGAVATDLSIGNVWDLGLSYENQFSGGIKLSAAASGEFGNGDVAGTQDSNAWNIGALLGWKGFSVAGSYGDWSDSNRAAGGLDGSIGLLVLATKPVRLACRLPTSIRRVTLRPPLRTISTTSFSVRTTNSLRV